MVLAESKTCATLDCVDTRGADTMTGRDNASDRIAGMEGDYQIDGGGGSDTLYGDEGNGTIRDDSDALDVDTVNCGPGTKDRVFFDKGVDTIHKSCEIRKPAQQWHPRHRLASKWWWLGGRPGFGSDSHRRAAIIRHSVGT